MTLADSGRNVNVGAWVRVDTWGVTQLPPYALSRALLAKKISPTNATSATIHVLDGSQSEEAHVQQTLGALLGCAHILQQIKSTACHSLGALSNLCAVCPLGIPQH